MTLFYRYPDAIVDITGGGGSPPVTGDYTKVDDAYDASDATKDADYVTLDGHSSTYNGANISFTFANLESVGDTINRLILVSRLRVCESNNVRHGLMVSGTHYYDLAAGSAGTEFSPFETFQKEYLENPAALRPWALSDLGALKAKLYDQRNALGYDYCSSIYLIIDASPPNPRALNVAREIASAELRFTRRALMSGTLTGNLDLLNVSQLGLLDIEHVAGPHPSDQGWLSPVWKRRTFEVRGLTVSLNSGIVKAQLVDQNAVAASVWFPAYSTKASGVMEDGIARLFTPGATWTFERASEQTITNPVGESETVPEDVPAYTTNGIALLAASGGLAGCRASWTNNTGYRTWPAAQGRAACEVYLASVSGSVNQTLFYVYHDASNYAWAYWNGASGRWQFDVRAGGVTYSAYKSASPSSGVTYQVGLRWTGAQGELDASPYTISIWVDRVKGTDAVAAAMTQASSSTFDIGSKAGVGNEPLLGYMRKIGVSPVVWTDIEMARTI